MNENEGWTNISTMKIWCEVFCNFSVKGWDSFCVGFSRPDELAHSLKEWSETYIKNLELENVVWEEVAQNMIDTYHHG